MSSKEKMNWSPTCRTRSRGGVPAGGDRAVRQALAAHGQEQRVLAAEHVHRLVHLRADLALGDARGARSPAAARSSARRCRSPRARPRAPRRTSRARSDSKASVTSTNSVGGQRARRSSASATRMISPRPTIPIRPRDGSSLIALTTPWTARARVAHRRLPALRGDAVGHVLREDQLGLAAARDEREPVAVREVVVGDPPERALVAPVVVADDEQPVEVVLGEEVLQERLPAALLGEAELDPAAHGGRGATVARDGDRRARGRRGPGRQRPDLLRPAHAQVHAFALLARRSPRTVDRGSRGAEADSDCGDTGSPGAVGVRRARKPAGVIGPVAGS